MGITLFYFLYFTLKIKINYLDEPSGVLTYSAILFSRASCPTGTGAYFSSDITPDE
jgi:hypothetical protein